MPIRGVGGGSSSSGSGDGATLRHGLVWAVAGAVIPVVG